MSNAIGTSSDAVAYSLPNNATSGTYTVTTRVASSHGSARRDTYFTVQ